MPSDFPITAELRCAWRSRLVAPFARARYDCVSTTPEATREAGMALALWLAAILLIATAGAPVAAEGPQIAQDKKLTGQATIFRSGEHLPVKMGDPLFEKDVVRTG